MKYSINILSIVALSCCAIATCSSGEQLSQPQNIEDIFDSIASGVVNIIGLPRRGATGNDPAVPTEPQNVLDIVDAIQSGTVIILGLGGDGSIAASQPQDYQQLGEAIAAGVRNIVGFPGRNRDAGESSNGTIASSQPQSIVEIVQAVQGGTLVILGLPRRGISDANQNQGRTKRSVAASISSRAQIRLTRAGANN